jgi:hypothetical protein
VCERGHAYFRTYDAGSWYLACCQCPHRIFEGEAYRPAVAEVVDLPLPAVTQPEEEAA